MTDFWRDSGYHLLARNERGHLAVTDDFLRAFFLRPEVRPVAESCAAERALHEALLRNPREAVAAERLAAFADPDARENYEVVLRLRDQLIAAGTVEGCYLRTFLDANAETRAVDLPPLFLDQMAHVVARAMLDGCEDAMRVRAAELLFRPQMVTVADGAILAGDAETVETYATTGGFGSLGRLVAEAQTPLRSIDLDVLTETNADLYWQRDQRYDTVLDMSFTRPGLDALCRVLETWIRHFLDVAVTIQPVQQISDDKWVWHIGLDVEGSRLLNDLYSGVEVDEERLARLLTLFRMEFAEPDLVIDAVAGRPVYLALCMTPDKRLRLKPQNLLVNLPLAERA